MIEMFNPSDSLWWTSTTAYSRAESLCFLVKMQQQLNIYIF